MMENKNKRLLAYLEETALRLIQETAHTQATAELQKSDEPLDTLKMIQKDWPHRSDEKIIRLKTQISDCEWELKRLENQMVCVEKTRLRRFRSKRRLLLERLEQLYAARFAADSWEEYFLMFREDEKLRRSSWMEPEFYEKERTDICRKLAPCSGLCRPVEEKVFSLLGQNAGTDGREKTLSETFRDEVHWYAVGCLFLEQDSKNSVELLRG
ncbi:MAG: hypothetical protein SPF91_00290 [Clostridium sp.]|nr:hypothetical protein [Clostridium sp.]